jgi:hypothetical protein
MVKTHVQGSCGRLLRDMLQIVGSPRACSCRIGAAAPRPFALFEGAEVVFDTFIAFRLRHKGFRPAALQASKAAKCSRTPWRNQFQSFKPVFVLEEDPGCSHEEKWLAQVGRRKSARVGLQKPLALCRQFGIAGPFRPILAGPVGPCMRIGHTLSTMIRIGAHRGRKGPS